MRKHWKYLLYVLRHKLYVYQAGRRLGLGRLQLLIHDWHKFLPDEWGPYVRKFYGGNYPDEAFRWRNPQFGDILTQERVDAAFELAWLRHQKRGRHHWQWWLLPLDDGGTKILEMPSKYRREMLADWRGAGRAITGKDETRAWYLKNREKMQLHPDTRAWIERELELSEDDL